MVAKVTHWYFYCDHFDCVLIDSYLLRVLCVHDFVRLEVPPLLPKTWDSLLFQIFEIIWIHHDRAKLPGPSFTLPLAPAATALSLAKQPAVLNSNFQDKPWYTCIMLIFLFGSFPLLWFLFIFIPCPTFPLVLFVFIIVCPACPMQLMRWTLSRWSFPRTSSLLLRKQVFTVAESNFALCSVGIMQPWAKHELESSGQKQFSLVFLNWLRTWFQEHVPFNCNFHSFFLKFKYK